MSQFDANFTQSVMQSYGFDDEEIDRHLQTERDISLLAQQSMNEREPADEGIVAYWKGVIESVKESAVGEEFEFEEYWKRGLGVSTLSLAKQYHTGRGFLDEDYRAALEPEPADTGHLERFIETATTLIGDIPVGIAAGLPAGVAVGAATGGTGALPAAGAAAGFVTEGMRQTYIEALQRGQVDGPEEWWDMFVQKGLGEATKAGIIMGAGTAAPGIVGALGGSSTALKLGTQYAVFAGLGPALEGRLPTKNELINVGLLMGTFGLAGRGAEKATNMIMKRVGSSKKDTSDVIEDLARHPDMLEDAVSTNMKTFRREVPEGEKLQAAFDGGKPPKDRLDPIAEEPKKRIEEFEEPLMSPVEAVNKVAETIEYSVPKSPLIGRLVDAKNRAVTNYLDRLHPAFVAEKKFQEFGGKINEVISAYQQLRIGPGQIGKAMEFLRSGTFKFDTPTQKTGLGLIEIFKKYKPKDMKEFDVYAKSKRAIERDAQGLETGVDIAAAKQAVAALESKHGATFRGYVNFNERVLDYMVDGGLISKETRKSLLENSKDYVPFARVMEPDATGAFSSIVRNPFKAFKGSERKTFSPSETIFMNTINNIVMTERNFTNVKFIEMIESMPDAFPNIKKSSARVKQTRLTREEMEGIVNDPSALKPEVLDGMSIYRRDGQQLTTSEIVIFRNGKREVWNVGEDLAAVFKDATQAETNMLVKMAEPFSKTLRLGATLAPDFVVRNFSRDTLMAGVFSNNSFIPLYHSLTGFKSLVLRGDKMYENFVKSGAMQSMFISMDRNYFAKDMKSFMQADKMRNTITNPLEWLRVAAEMFETSSRLGEFKLTYNKLKKNQTLTDKEILEASGFAARDITLDFGRMGVKVAGWNRVNAFLNATIQGNVKLYEAFKNNPVRTSMRINAFIVAPSVLFWIMNHDDERYKQLPRWQKDLFWIFITGDGTVKDGDYTVWRIPKPFGPGIIFGTGTERMLDHFVGQDPEAMKMFVNDQVAGFGTLTGLLPDVVRPAFEIGTNLSFFTKKPIVPRYLEKTLPEYQYNEYTSATGKLIGSFLAETTNGAFGSPAAVDHIISSWTGTLGRYALELSDHIIKKAGLIEEPEEPLKTLADVPFIKAFVVRNPTGGSEYVERFYKRFEKVNQRLTAINKLISENNAEEAFKVYGETDMTMLPLVDIQTAISAQTRWIKAIYNSDMRPEEKRQAIDDTYRAMIELAKTGLELSGGL